MARDDAPHTLHRSRWWILCLSASLVLPNALGLIVERPCCSLMTHVSGEFTDFDALAHSPLAATELVPVAPFHACEPLATPLVAGRVALVQRGGCNFVKKVWHAQQAGAVGVVVMDAARRDEAPFHIIMQKDENATELTIPAVFVSYGDGEKLLRFIAKALPWSPVLITLSEFGELPQDRTKFKIIKRAIAYIFLVSAVCALSSGLSIVSSFLFSKVGNLWRTRVTKRLPLLRYRPLLQRELLDHAIREIHVLDRIILDDVDDDEAPPLSTFDDVLVHSDVGDDAEACSICLDDFATGERVKVLPCQHFFHVTCIDPWLEKRSGRCPLCKHDAIAAIDDAPKSLFGFALPPLEQVLRQEHWFHTFFLMLPASLVSCLIVNSAASLIRSMWP